MLKVPSYTTQGDFCRGKGDKPSHCGASEKENCNGRAVYRVTSDFYMPRENCDVCPRELADAVYAVAYVLAARRRRRERVAATEFKAKVAPYLVEAPEL